MLRMSSEQFIGDAIYSDKEKFNSLINFLEERKKKEYSLIKKNGLKGVFKGGMKGWLKGCKIREGITIKVFFVNYSRIF